MVLESFFGEQKKHLKSTPGFFSAFFVCVVFFCIFFCVCGGGGWNLPAIVFEPREWGEISEISIWTIFCIFSGSPVDQTKWLVFRMIHGSRIPDPTNGQFVWSTWTYCHIF